jgi:hypothetical protein
METTKYQLIIYLIHNKSISQGILMFPDDKLLPKYVGTVYMELKWIL